MMQSVWSVENTKEYWEKVVEDTDRILQEVPDRVLERISTGTCKRIGKESET